ncbi:MAG: ribosome assembly factor SBDS [Candidatus Woesearchaeota archaeon]
MSKGYTFVLKDEQPHINVARYIKERSKHFEVAIDPDLAEEFKKGAIKDVREVLKSEEIFTDVKKGIRPTEKELIETFGTKDKLKIAEIIIKKGIVQVSEEYREKLREQKRRRIIELIRVNCVDAKTGLPLPTQRIENALSEAKVKIEENKSAEDQLYSIINKLKVVIPIKSHTETYDIKIPAKYSSKSTNIIKQFGLVENEKWNSDGSFSCRIKVPAGMREEFFDKVNLITRGEAQINKGD